MIFVTVGTTHGFDRLIKAVDRAVDQRTLTEEVFAQIGNGTYKPRYFPYAAFLDKTAFDAHIQRASGIISHAGMGILTAASDCGKPILVMPRRRKYGEVVNDHQVALAEEFGRRGHVLYTHDEEDFILRVTSLREFVPVPRQTSVDAVIGRIRDFLNGLNGVPQQA